MLWGEGLEQVSLSPRLILRYAIAFSSGKRAVGQFDLNDSTCRKDSSQKKLNVVTYLALGVGKQKSVSCYLSDYRIDGQKRINTTFC
jgi:hypothetical protein